jgi:hypothetical protein
MVSNKLPVPVLCSGLAEKILGKDDDINTRWLFGPPLIGVALCGEVACVCRAVGCVCVGQYCVLCVGQHECIAGSHVYVWRGSHVYV